MIRESALESSDWTGLNCSTYHSFIFFDSEQFLTALDMPESVQKYYDQNYLLITLIAYLDFYPHLSGIRCSMVK